MTYDELITKITQPMVDAEYYNLLLDHSKTIVIQTSISSKKEVAKDLGMSPQVFATAVKFISASATRS